MYRPIAIVITTLALAGGLGACSSTDVVAPTMNVSIGQQLIDLKTARDKGAISQSEWQQQKQHVIDSVR